MTSPRRTAAIMGLGLVGGSLARDLAGLGWRVAGADRDPATIEAATAAGVVDPAFGAGDGATADMPDVEIIVIATPVRAVAGLLRWLGAAAPTGAVITDVSSTKRSVLAAAQAVGLAHRFVGSHPMAGDHRSGWAAARTGMFAGAPVWLCHAGAPDAARDRVAALWTAVGASPRAIEADAHDRLVAWSSHLPQVAASALAAVLARAGVLEPDLGPGGRDATRLAGGDPELWCHILADNADMVTPALDALVHQLTQVAIQLRARDDQGVRALLDEGRAWADRSGGTPPGHRMFRSGR
jgi:prephenate dehydrogenase